MKITLVRPGEDDFIVHLNDAARAQRLLTITQQWGRAGLTLDIDTLDFMEAAGVVFGPIPSGGSIELGEAWTRVIIEREDTT